MLIKRKLHSIGWGQQNRKETLPSPLLRGGGEGLRGRWGGGTVGRGGQERDSGAPENSDVRNGDEANKHKKQRPQPAAARLIG